VPHVVAVALFILLALLFVMPVLEGKKLKQDDILRHKGMSKEVVDFRNKTGTEALWTNSMFGGMPAYQISVNYKGNIVARFLDKIMTLGLPHPAGYIFLYFIGFYILLLVLGVNPWVSIAGAIAFAFSSYFIIILEAGHNSKAHAIGYMAPVLAGIILTYQRKYLLGGILTALFLSLELKANHPQITYYLLLMVLIFGIIELVHSIRKKVIIHFIKATAILLIALVLAILTNFSSLWATYEYGKYTIRGKTELTSEKENRTSGLDKDYATDWSYGISESFTLMVPNFKGGSSVPLGLHEHAMSKVAPEYQNAVANSYQYFGDQPFTSGPVYAGSIIVFLFILGVIIVPGRFKWFLLVATLLSLMLSWGKNFMPLTDFFLEHFPGYNKFRAVSMTLVIAEVTIPVLAFLCVQRIYMKPEIIKRKLRPIVVAFALTGGLIIIFLFFPRAFFSFITGTEYQQFEEYRKSGATADQISIFISNLETARVSIFRSDLVRSLLFIFMGAISLLIYSYEKMNKTLFAIVLSFLMLIDLWPVDKRYLNADNFVRKSVVDNPFPMTAADKQILRDKDPDYRVLNLTVNTYNDASTSYYHKSIGGYHGAKLRRYQELIEHHLSKNRMPVFNMLNTRYFIVPDEEKRPGVMQNPGALGNAWFVKDYVIVPDADTEIDSLSGFNPATTAILDKRFEKELNGLTIVPDSAATISLTSYQPNRLTYQYRAATDQLAVFSEIYYDKGWDAFIDGKPAPYFRANYVLRAMVVPAGEHGIEFRFEPRVYATGEKISYAGSILLIVVVLGYAGYALGRYTRKHE
jgi:hypothetical protein